MIRKPAGFEQEDRLHAAVGTVLQTGAEVGALGRRAQKAGRYAGVYYIFGIMGFGLLFSNTPILFKLLVGGAGFWLFKKVRNKLRGDHSSS